MSTPASNVKTKKKSKAMQPVVIRMPKALIAMVRKDARASGKDVSTYIRDVLSASPEPKP